MISLLFRWEVLLQRTESSNWIRNSALVFRFNKTYFRDNVTRDCRWMEWRWPPDWDNGKSFSSECWNKCVWCRIWSGTSDESLSWNPCTWLAKAHRIGGKSLSNLENNQCKLWTVKKEYPTPTEKTVVSNDRFPRLSNVTDNLRNSNHLLDHLLRQDLLWLLLLHPLPLVGRHDPHQELLPDRECPETQELGPDLQVENEGHHLLGVQLSLITNFTE